MSCISISAKTLAVSAIGSVECATNAKRFSASTLWTACPISCASVFNDWASPVWLRKTYGVISAFTVAQNAPPRLPSAGYTCTWSSSKTRFAASWILGENCPKTERTFCLACS